MTWQLSDSVIQENIRHYKYMLEKESDPIIQEEYRRTIEILTNQKIMFVNTAHRKNNNANQR